ncbi:hypothetical protein SAMN05443247_06435 [Bradyrhizobium erythrophlei]|nr:hypothetical protein SAMN05443247_06435 [Bradyrhizobium erythrophlei]
MNVLPREKQIEVIAALHAKTPLKVAHHGRKQLAEVVNQWLFSNRV